MTMSGGKTRPRALLSVGVGLVLASAALALGLGRRDSRDLFSRADRVGVTTASIEFFERRLLERPGSFTTGNALVDRYLLRFQEEGRLSDLRRGEEVARQVSRVMTWAAAPRVRLSAILLRLHRMEEAEREARAAAALKPKSGNPVLFDALLERGAYEEARAVLGELDPRSFSHRVRYAHLHKLLGNLDGAELALRRACRTLRGAGIAGATLAWCYTELADIAWAEGNERLTRHLLVRALEAFPGYAGALEHLAWMAYRRGQLEKARDLYQRVLTGDAEADVHLQLARIAEQLGQRELAEQHVRAFEDAATSPVLRPLYIRYLALHYASKPGGQARAVALAREDAARRPTVQSYDVLSWALYRAGQVPGALEASQKALAWGRPEALTLYHAGMIRLDAGEEELGLQYLRQAVARAHELDPADEAAARAVLAGRIAARGPIRVAPTVVGGPPRLGFGRSCRRLITRRTLPSTAATGSSKAMLWIAEAT